MKQINVILMVGLLFLFFSACKPETVTPDVPKCRITKVFRNGETELENEYNSSGKLIKRTHPQYRYYETYTYQSDRTIKLTYDYTAIIPFLSDSTVYILNSSGNVITETNTSFSWSSSDHTMNYEYDANGYLKKMDYMDINANNYAYEFTVVKGNIISATNTSGSYSNYLYYSYYPDKKQVSVEEPLTFGKTSENLVQEEIYTDGNNTNTYNYSYELDENGYITTSYMNTSSSDYDTQYEYSCD